MDISGNLLDSLAPDAPNAPGLQVMHCKENPLSAYEDCLAIDALQQSGIDDFDQCSPLTGGSRSLVCANVEKLNPGRVVWGDPEARFCGSVSPDIRDFICFLNNDSSCPQEPCTE